MSIKTQHGTYPTNWQAENRWFCGTVDVIEEDPRKTIRAPWLDEHPEDGHEPGWDEMVGWNWPGVRTDLATAEGWASKINDWFLATAIPSYDTDGDARPVRDMLVDLDDVVDPDTGAVHPQAQQIIDTAGSYAQLSYSGTGVHVYLQGKLPEGLDPSFSGELHDWEHSNRPEIEVYARQRFIALTGKHIVDTPTEVRENQDLVNKLFYIWGEVEDQSGSVGGIDFDDREPDHTPEETRNTDTTADISMVYDAIAHTDISDIRLHSTETESRLNGSKSFDPSWETSKSGTRLGYEDGGFIYRDGMVGLDILQVVALEERIISNVRKYPEGGDFWAAVEALRDRGADIPEYDSSEDAAEPMSTLPLQRLDRLDHDEQRRYARTRGVEWPSVDKVRDDMHEMLLEQVGQNQKSVIAAPTSAGKTHTVATEPWLTHKDMTGDRPVIHAHRTREARDQATEMSDEAGVESYAMKGRTELCPLARGDYDPGNSHGNSPITVEDAPVSEWIEHRCNRQGVPFSVVHGWVESAVDRTLPCEMDGDCASKGQFDGVPRDDDGNPNYDVVHCTHQFLYVPSLRMHTHVFIDEKPSFGIDLSPEAVRESIKEYLTYIDAPVDTYDELVHAAKHGKHPDVSEGQTVEGLVYSEYKKSFAEAMERALSGENKRIECPECDGTGKLSEEGPDSYDVGTYEKGNPEEPANNCPECDGTGMIMEVRGRPPLSWYRNHVKAHALAPAFTRAVWRAERSADGRYAARVPYQPPRFDAHSHNSDAWNRVYVDLVLDESLDPIEVDSCPDMTLASSVTGMDAHPMDDDPFWQANCGESMSTKRVLDSTQRALYRRYERGLNTVQVGEGVQPVTSGQWLDEGQGEKFELVIEHIAEHYEDRFDSAITSMSATQLVREAMQENGVDEPDMMHYGEEESRNDFAGKDIGLVVGSIDPGDEMILNMCARLGYDVEVPTRICRNCDGGGHVEGGDDEEFSVCENCNGRGEKRERGRTFEGPDAEKAMDVLRGVREHHVAQSAGRWARDPDDPEDSATVFLITEAAPEGFIDAYVPGVTWTTNEGQRERLEYVRESGSGVTARDVAEATGCSKRTAIRTLQRAAEEGVLERTPGTGPYGADVYSPDENYNPAGKADITPEPISRQSGYEPHSTYTVTIQSLPHTAYNAEGGDVEDWRHQSTFDWFELPRRVG